jgi:hypothetical protein
MNWALGVLEDEREKHIETKGKETERQISINYFARFQF